MANVFIGGQKIVHPYVGGTAVQHIYLGSSQVWPEPPPPFTDYINRYVTAGDEEYTTHVDELSMIVILLGGGGAGGVGGGVMNGGGGGAGEWNSIKLLQGTHYAKGGKVLFHVGAGGAPCKSNHSMTPNPQPTAVNNGGDTWVKHLLGTTTAHGGKADAGRGKTHNGYSPGDYRSPVSGVVYHGGVTPQHSAAQSVPEAGVAPGAGGSGSASAILTNGNDGGAGAVGEIWVLHHNYV